MTHKRSPPPTTEPPLKRVRFSKSSPPSSSPDRTHIYASVGDGTMSVELTLPMDIAALAQSYRTAKQKHIVIHELFNEDALQTFCDLYLARPQAEIESGIYKVYQPSDTANVCPALSYIKDALYSTEFCALVSQITGCETLSSNTGHRDTAVYMFMNGCYHLVISDPGVDSGRISFVLQIPAQPWQVEWGGAVELYSSTYDPTSVDAIIIPPRRNQLVLCDSRTRQSITEVLAPHHHQMICITGSFRPAQEGNRQPKSITPTLEGGSRTWQPERQFYRYPDSRHPPTPESPLTADNISFLSDFMNPHYLEVTTLKKLQTEFRVKKCLRLSEFLKAAMATQLETGLRAADSADGLDSASRHNQRPDLAAGASSGAWKVRGPLALRRHCVLVAPPNVADNSADEGPRRTMGRAAEERLRSIQDDFGSGAFRNWLCIITKQLPQQFSSSARRFRPGLDYILPMCDDQPKLDVVLCTTPTYDNATTSTPSRNTRGKQKSRVNGWETGTWGGYQCYLPAINKDEEEIRYSCQFNSLVIVQRDPEKKHFTKYVSASAPGSRWDVCGEYLLNDAPQLQWVNSHRHRDCAA